MITDITHRPIDVLYLGGIDLDLVMTVPYVPGPDEKAVGELVGRLPGGPAGNSACAASRLGLNVSSHCQVGDDEGGRILIDDFKMHGVDTSLIEVVEGQETPFTIILIDPSGEKVIIIVPTFQGQVSMDVTARALEKASYLYTMPGGNLERFLDFANAAHAGGAQVFIDVEPDSCSDPAKLEPILRATDIANFNQFGFVAARGQQPSIEAAQKLLDYGPHTVIVTLGSKGALAVTKDEAVSHPGFAVDVKDTTGAGDTFNAAFLAGTIHGKPLAERVHFACATAAMSVTAIGPRGYLPTVEEVEKFLRENNNVQ